MTQMRAMVIDDSKATRMILARMLQGLGLEVAHAGNGREALEQLAEAAAPDLFLVDWNMPEMSGIDFVRAVRNPPYASTARIVMVTTETETPQMVEALQAGADEYVMKPFTPDTILSKLRLVGLDV
jgi:two-component system, chemotaxis family, chemotaxis protein CheY